MYFIYLIISKFNNMYTIINNTTRKNTKIEGNFPQDLVVEMLEKGDDLIIISTYSNTIKIPYLEPNSNNYGETKSSKDWDFKDYNY